MVASTPFSELPKIVRSTDYFLDKECIRQNVVLTEATEVNTGESNLRRRLRKENEFFQHVHFSLMP
jgi:hypothetical protein